MNAFLSPRFRLGWVLVLIGLVNSLFWTGFRWHFENGFLRTQITLDYEDTRSLADAYGMKHVELLKAFYKQGARSLALNEQSLNNLRDNGRISITAREEAERLFPDADWVHVPELYRYLITSSDGELLAHIRPLLADQTLVPVRPLVLRQARSLHGEIPFGLLLPPSKQLFGDAQLGFDPLQVDLAKKAGFSITARLFNTINLTPERMERMLDEVQATGAHVVIFSDEEVMGYQSLLAATAKEMRKRDLFFTNIEFTKQRGADDFAMSSEGMLTRVHSVTGDEAAKAKPEVLVARYTRAAKERNFRVLYVRLLRQNKGEPAKTAPGDEDAELKLEKTAYQQNLDFIGQIRRELTNAPSVLKPFPFIRPGLEMGQAQPFTDYPMKQFGEKFGPRGAKIVRFAMIFLAGLGTVGFTLLLLNLFFDLSPRAQQLWLAAGLVIIAPLSLSPGKGAMILGLQAGWTCSVVGVLWGGLPLIWDGRQILEGKLTPTRVALFGLKVLIRTTVLTLIGGFFVVALLNNWKFMSHADDFLGEKATQFIPLFVVALAFLGEIFPHRVEEEGSEPGRRLALSRVQTALDKPFTARTVMVSLIVMAMISLWMARFGNDSGMEISPMELKLRGILEQVFLTRPRTKEISLCHPAFLFAVFFMLRRQKLWALAAVVAATIGQADVLNSMCHIHTPVFYCIWRTVTGIFIGTFVGWICLVIWDFVEVRWNRLDPLHRLSSTT